MTLLRSSLALYPNCNSLKKDTTLSKNSKCKTQHLKRKNIFQPVLTVVKPKIQIKSLQLTKLEHQNSENKSKKILKLMMSSKQW